MKPTIILSVSKGKLRMLRQLRNDELVAYI